MAKILTTLPDAPETKFFRALQGILQTDIYLEPLIKRWAFLQGAGGSLVGKGQDYDFDAPKASVDEMPALRAWIGAGNYAPDHTAGLRGNMQVQIRLWAPGTDQDDMTNLWNVVARYAIRPRAAYGYPDGRYDEVQQIFRAIKGFGYAGDATGPIEARAENEARNYLTMQGAVAFNILIPT